MNKAIRCPAIDKDGHRCRLKVGHLTFTDPPQPLHIASGKTFSMDHLKVTLPPERGELKVIKVPAEALEEA